MISPETDVMRDECMTLTDARGVMSRPCTLTLQHFLTMEKGFSYITLHQPAQAVKIKLK